MFYFASRGLWHVRTLFGQSGLGDQTKSKAEVCLESCFIKCGVGIGERYEGAVWVEGS